jgi:hypothetical protein
MGLGLRLVVVAWWFRVVVPLRLRGSSGLMWIALLRIVLCLCSALRIVLTRLCLVGLVVSGRCLRRLACLLVIVAGTAYGLTRGTSYSLGGFRLVILMGSLMMSHGFVIGCEVGLVVLCLLVLLSVGET